MLSDYITASNLLRVVKEGDIVEFNRLTYLHYALYIGNGICVHVQQDGGDSAILLGSSSGSGAGAKESYKIAEKLERIAGKFGGRVNNLETLAEIHRVKRRPIADILEKAKSGFPIDIYSRSKQVVTGVKVHVEYEVISNNNCEGYVTYWRYDHPTGWSIQVSIAYI